MPDAMHVACIAEHSYWRHTAAMLHSLHAQHPGEAVNFYVLHGEQAPAEEVERMRGFVAGLGRPLRFLPIAAARIAGFPGGLFPRAVWYRVLLPELMPELDKVLYLDSDLLVLHNLRPLWETDLGEHVLGAVTNPLPPPLQSHTARLGLEPSQYFNSGVLLMNLARLREDRAAARLLELSLAHPEHTCPDQDALSVQYHSQRLALHPRWNFQTVLYDLKPRQVPYFSADELREARAHPAIVHFSGLFKPWHYLNRYPCRERYFEHARQTPWPILPLEGKTRINTVLRLLPPNWIWRYFLASSWIYDRLRPLWHKVRPYLKPLLG